MSSLKGLSVRWRRNGEGGYGTAGDNMAKFSGTLKVYGRLPGVVWWTSADTALYSRGHTKLSLVKTYSM